MRISYLPRLVPLSLWLVSLLLLIASPSQSQPLLLDRIAAIVEDDIIMETELVSRLQEFKLQIQQRGARVPDDIVLVPQVLNYVILESLQVQMARRNGIQAEEADIRSAMEATAAQNQLSLDDFLTQLQEQGLDPSDLRDRIESQILVSRVQSARLGPRIRITEQEIESFLDSDEGQSLFADEFLVHHILLRSTESLSATKKKATELVQRIRDGEDFEALATQFSTSRTALNGGNLDWRKLAELPRKFGSAVRRMQRGDISDPIEDGDSVHILRLTDRRGDTANYARQYKIRHILLRPNAVRDLPASREELLEIRERIANGEDFVELAKEFSEDPNTALLGGDLGWVSADQLPPEFTAAVEGLQPGSLSEVFQSEAGWHLIELSESRIADIAPQRMQVQAQNVLYRRKFEEELDVFLGSLREESFVDLKGEWAQFEAP